MLNNERDFLEQLINESREVCKSTKLGRKPETIITIAQMLFQLKCMVATETETITFTEGE